jgi:hypothetical protein
MVFEVKTLADMDAGTLVSVLFDNSNQIYCRKTLPEEPPDAITARVTREGDLLIFDTGRDTNDLLRPRTYGSR